ncbi:uncharacterized protein OCT59_017929 [Rhizophagus irregularis]|uniref:uncharacterized protein n=1 Tax=Rhizophagus irregularis TaxID=588596 RepID=UPI000CC01052|nr:hypothetical protein OCT59_017929 [Rhizophagus irregularis]
MSGEFPKYNISMGPNNCPCHLHHRSRIHSNHHHRHLRHLHLPRFCHTHQFISVSSSSINPRAFKSS